MKRLTWLAMLLMTVLPAAVSVACPMCKDSIPNSDAEQAAGLPSGFNFSIYYMLAGLFCTIGLVAGVITKGIRDSNSAMRRGSPPER